jgi:5-methylcytosine-specific restriction protein A
VLNSLGLSPYCAPKDCLYPDEVNENELKEGHASQVLVNRYERNAEARKKCIELKGCLCAVCGMDFEKEYGEIGRGFIHVHHIVPLSSIGEDYVINYEKDLVPVCPNCHAMLHRKNPPYTIDVLKELIALSNK